MTKLRFASVALFLIASLLLVDFAFAFGPCDSRTRFGACQVHWQPTDTQIVFTVDNPPGTCAEFHWHYASNPVTTVIVDGQETIPRGQISEVVFDSCTLTKDTRNQKSRSANQSGAGDQSGSSQSKGALSDELLGDLRKGGIDTSAAVPPSNSLSIDDVSKIVGPTPTPAPTNSAIDVNQLRSDLAAFDRQKAAEREAAKLKEQLRIAEEERQREEQERQLEVARQAAAAQQQSEQSQGYDSSGASSNGSSIVNILTTTQSVMDAINSARQQGL
jgi:hypothetical protein